jgi:hypothetical protein
VAVFSFNFFERQRECRDSNCKKAAFGGDAFRLEKTGFSCFSFDVCMYFPGV